MIMKLLLVLSSFIFSIVADTITYFVFRKFIILEKLVSIYAFYLVSILSIIVYMKEA